MKDFLSFVLRGRWAEGGFVAALIILIYGSLGVYLFFVVVTGIVLNVPIVAFALTALQQSNFNYQSLAMVGWFPVSLWVLFVVGQIWRSETRRILPVTLLEIRIRHALNCW